MVACLYRMGNESDSQHSGGEKMKSFTILESSTNQQVKVSADFFEIKDGRVYFKRREADDGSVVAVFNLDNVFGFALEPTPEGRKENDA